MNSTPRRAVITGIGVITPLGLDADSFWQALRAGTNPVKPLTVPQVSAFPVQFGAAVEGFEPTAYLEKKERKRLAIMPRPFQFAAACSRLALRDANLTLDQVDPTRLATVLG